jgi:hypothetical protein
LDFVTKGLWLHYKSPTTVDAIRELDRQLSSFATTFQRVFNTVNSNPERPGRMYRVEIINIELSDDLKTFFTSIYRDGPTVRAPEELEFVQV